MMNKRKQEILEVRDTAVTPFSQAHGVSVTSAWADCNHQKPTRNPGVPHVSYHTICEKTREGSTAPPPQSTRTPGVWLPPGAPHRQGLGDCL